MGFTFEDRPSDSPYVVGIARVCAETDIAPLCPAYSCWELIIRKQDGRKNLLVSGPMTKASVVPSGEGSEFIVIKFKLGTYMPHLPARHFVDMETRLPEATGHSFWLDGTAWQFPDYENADTFVDWLVRADVLRRDPVVSAVLQQQTVEMSSRAVRHHFLYATGLTFSMIRQIERAEQAAALLEQGVSILDTVERAGYADQPHLTRALKRFTGQTPTQIARLNQL